MAQTIDQVRVWMAADGFYPRSFRWAGREIRVLSVAGLTTCGRERRFRLRTVEGEYELVEDTAKSIWRMRRSPTWFSRTMAQLAQEPRYTLPKGRTRGGQRPRSGRDGEMVL